MDQFFKTVTNSIIFVIFFASYLFSQQTDAEEFIQLAEKFSSEKNFSQAANYYNKAAYWYWQNQNYDNALQFFDQSLELNKQIGNENAIHIISANKGKIHAEMGQSQKAIEIFREDLKQSRKLKKRTQILSSIINLSTELIELNSITEAIELLEEGLIIAKELKIIDLTTRCYGMLSEAYKKDGNSEKSIENFNFYSALLKKQQQSKLQTLEQRTFAAEKQHKFAKSQIVEKDKQIASKEEIIHQTRDSLFVVEQINKRKQYEIELAQFKLKEQQAQMTLQKMQKKGLIIGLFVLVVIIVLVFVLFLSKRKSNKLLKKQYDEIIKQKEKINRQKEKITESITYAQNIQDGMLSLSEGLDVEFEHFIFYKACHIVSGDFFWYTKIPKNAETKYMSNVPENRNAYIFAVADCTGHGVPGAFMSIIGWNSLNQIVNMENMHDPSEILTELNKKIRQDLKQDKNDNSDGMDVCICAVYPDILNGYKIIFSGANRPLIYYNRKKEEMTYEKGTRKTIGGRYLQTEKEYTNIELDLVSGDMLLLTTDGIIDQNNNKNRRFGRSRFMNAISYKINSPLKNMNEYLHQEIKNYMNGVPQRDDMTVIGIKL